MLQVAVAQGDFFSFISSFLHEWDPIFFITQTDTWHDIFIIYLYYLGNCCVSKAEEFKLLCTNAIVLKNVLVGLHETKGDLLGRQDFKQVNKIIIKNFICLFWPMNILRFGLMDSLLGYIAMQHINSLPGGSIQGWVKGMLLSFGRFSRFNFANQTFLRWAWPGRRKQLNFSPFLLEWWFVVHTTTTQKTMTSKILSFKIFTY